MTQAEKGIHPKQLPNVVSLTTPDSDGKKLVSEDDPAIKVMTDLKVVKPYSIRSNACIESINNKMIACGVRMLFVNDPMGDLAGLVTTSDINGKKPLQFANQNGCSRDDIKASDLMTPISRLEAIPIKEVLSSHVSDIVSAFEQCRRNHMLVMESNKEGKVIRGIFSITQVSKQLDTYIPSSIEDTNFEELNEALA
ncbi:hypothetical protein GCM10009133_14160 [Cocleimonas flava]|jgi:CBS domain containing-hemolysin-like protein|uniref:CBS domain protein n=1 Tax=Cocleimonas flava TaxID=634765 RepID=A0A4R1F599_9GAMM|nr:MULTISPECIES: hypothetical protein [Cocleimonas]MEB8433038.1 hypothetical protein [Cocleimonas sp. KMM 6892]MEC4715981.1 hypothetical protein [Cocleimonas sp. KMM 6895]MEC4745442.1 hypothetical protein [Cocleimonas sp. KMM 6896]TCJ87784.1 hypothetical protein EV695_2299 [Cocleimonas flava]